MLRIERLLKTYGKKKSVDDLNLHTAANVSLSIYDYFWLMKHGTEFFADL